jgi:hypothetical protein
MDRSLLRYLVCFHDEAAGVMTTPRLVPKYMVPDYVRCHYVVMADPFDEHHALLCEQQIEAMRLQEERRWDRLFNERFFGKRRR